MAIIHFDDPDQAFENGDVYPKHMVKYEHVLPESKPPSAIAEVYLPTTSGASNSQYQITYTNLPKIPIRPGSLLSDLSLLGNQFMDTLVILQLLVGRRLFPRDPNPGLLQHNYRIVHLHTDPGTSLGTLSWSLMLRSSWLVEDVPLVFPVASGVWELLVKKSYLDKLLATYEPVASLNFQEPTCLPKGVVGRSAQIRSVAQPVDRWVSGLHLGLLERYPWNQVMKDTAESMSIHQSGYAVIGGRLYEL
ncbi:MAG: hypothetical protein Q9209_001938 [Squamulea sp. 1 TL-2023]